MVLAAPRTQAFEALRSRDFRLLWLGQGISLVGDAAFLTALGWRTFTLAGAGKLGIVLVCQATAMLATVLVGGALADRYPRRSLMIASDLARLAAVGVLAGIDAAGQLSFPILIVLATLMGLGDGFFYPASGGFVPLVVEPYAIASANSLIGVARWGSASCSGRVLRRSSTTVRARRPSSPSTRPRSSSRRSSSRAPGSVRSNPGMARGRCARSGQGCDTCRASPGSG
jgi:hypothetical protein